MKGKVKPVVFGVDLPELTESNQVNVRTLELKSAYDGSTASRSSGCFPGIPDDSSLLQDYSKDGVIGDALVFANDGTLR